MPGERRRIYRAIVPYYIIALLICFLDQFSKSWIKSLIAQSSSLPIVNNFFHITLVSNTGIAFGFFKRFPHFFIVISIAAIVIISLFLVYRFSALNAIERCSLSFILGGTFGNLIDRVRLGYVVDFIDFRVWPVFNIADSFITVGAVMLGWGMLLRGKRGQATFLLFHFSSSKK